MVCIAQIRVKILLHLLIINIVTKKIILNKRILLRDGLFEPIRIIAHRTCNYLHAALLIAERQGSFMKIKFVLIASGIFFVLGYSCAVEADEFNSSTLIVEENQKITKPNSIFITASSTARVVLSIFHTGPKHNNACGIVILCLYNHSFCIKEGSASRAGL